MSFAHELIKAYAEQKPTLLDGVATREEYKGILEKYETYKTVTINKLNLPYGWDVKDIVITLDQKGEPESFVHLLAETNVILRDDDILQFYRHLHENNIDGYVFEPKSGSLKQALERNLRSAGFSFRPEITNVFIELRYVTLYEPYFLEISATGEMKSKEFHFLDVTYDFVNSVKEKIFEEFLNECKKIELTRYVSGPEKFSKMLKNLRNLGSSVRLYAPYIPKEMINKMPEFLPHLFRKQDNP